MARCRTHDPRPSRLAAFGLDLALILLGVLLAVWLVGSKAGNWH